MAEKNFLIVGRGALIDPIQMLAFTGPVVVAAPFTSGNCDAVALRDPLHRLREAQLIVLHQKIENAAAGMTAKAMVNAFVLADRERWRFLTVKGAEAQMSAARFFQCHR